MDMEVAPAASGRGHLKGQGGGLPEPVNRNGGLTGWRAAGHGRATQQQGAAAWTSGHCRIWRRVTRNGVRMVAERPASYWGRAVGGGAASTRSAVMAAATASSTLAYTAARVPPWV